MTNDGIIYTDNVSGQEIQQILLQMEPILSQVPRTHALIAAITIALSTLDPEISMEKLIQGVKGASEWMCLYLSETGESGEAPKERMN